MFARSTLFSPPLLAVNDPEENIRVGIISSASDESLIRRPKHIVVCVIGDNDLL